MMTMEQIREEKRRFFLGFLLSAALGLFFHDVWLISVVLTIYFIREAGKVLEMESGTRYLFYFLALFPIINLISFFGVWIRFGNKEAAERGKEEREKEEAEKKEPF